MSYIYPYLPIDSRLSHPRNRDIQGLEKFQAHSANKQTRNYDRVLKPPSPQSSSGKISSINFFFFSWQNQHFKELRVSFSYLVLQVVLRWCSAKTGLLQKAVFIDFWNLVFVCHWSKSLKKTSEWRFFSWVEAVKTATLWINGFLHNNFTRI